MADVFISYAHENRDAARILAAAIEAKGYDVWWDRELVAGDDYTTKIEGLLDVAKAVIVIWSAESRKSYWVRDEAAVGRDRNRLLPIVIDDNPPPLGFRQIHTISLKGWDGKSEDRLQDLFAGLAGLVSGRATQTEETSAVLETNPFGAPAAPSDASPRQILAGVNAAPNNKSLQKILKEEKKQRGFLRTFWVTSMVLSAIFSVAMGVGAGFTENFGSGGAAVNIIVAFLFVSVGLILGRFLIVIGRRLSKRKSVRYFDSVTLICMALSILVVTPMVLMKPTNSDTGAQYAMADSLFIGTIVAFILLFPLCGFVSLIIGAFKGAKRKSFEDGA